MYFHSPLKMVLEWEITLLLETLFKYQGIILILLMARNIVIILHLFFKIYSSRELEETLNKIREILSDDKHDWDQRANAVSFLLFLFLSLSSFFQCSFSKTCKFSSSIIWYMLMKKSLIGNISFWKTH